jgi:hypothetical protein
MNRNDFLLQELDGMAQRAALDGIADEMERQREGARRRRSDEADGYFKPGED